MQKEEIHPALWIVLLNVCTVVTLIWCYFKGYSLTAILIAGFMLLGVVNFAI